MISDRTVSLGLVFLFGVAVGLALNDLSEAGTQRPSPQAVSPPQAAPVPRAIPMPYIAPVMGLQRYEDCMTQQRGLERRFQIAHKREGQPITIRCEYGPLWLAVANQEGM